MNVTMIREHLNEILDVPLAQEYAFKPLSAKDGALWLSIWEDAEEGKPVKPDVWEKEFSSRADEIQKRCFVVVDRGSGEAIATSSAWMGLLDGEDYGRVHWVATRAACKGRGIGQAMLSETLKRLSKYHEQAYLDTQSYRLNAIHIYKKFGFKPYCRTAEEEQAWDGIDQALKQDH